MCLHVLRWQMSRRQFATSSPPVRGLVKGDLPSIVYPVKHRRSRPLARLFYLCERICGDTWKPPSLRGTGRVPGQESTGFLSVIYSMRVRDVSPSFAVILAVPCPTEVPYTRDEGKTMVERGLKRGKGTRDRRTLRYGGYDKHNIFPSGRYIYIYTHIYWRNMLTARKHTNCINRPL